MKSTGAMLTGWDEDRTIDLEPFGSIASAVRKPPAAPHPDSRPPAVGRTAEIKLLRGRYMLVKPIGTGGTSVVYCARDLRRDEAGLEAVYVALKMPRPELNKDSRAVARLEREFACTQGLSHPNIVRVFDLDCHQDPEGELWFLTMELLEGELLGDLLRRTAPSPLPTPRAIDILRACGNALAFAHSQGVVHGDFKPGNVFITRQSRVCLLDFGASASGVADAAGRPVARSATPAYASPEVLSGQKPERRDDVFGFGCVAYQLLTGQHPFAHHSPANGSEDRLRSWNLSSRQWFALQSALARTRHDRPQDLRHLLEDLMPAETVAVAPVRTLEKSPFRSRAATLIPLMAVGVLLALGAMLYLSGSKLEVGIVDERGQRGQTNLPAIAPSVPTTPVAQSSQPPQSASVKPSVPPAKAAAEPARNPVPPSAQIFASPVDSAPDAATSVAVPQVPKPRLPPYQMQMTAAVPGGRISFDTASITVSESATAAVLTLDRFENTSGRTQVRWRIMPGTAQPGNDFGGLTMSGVADFVDGQAKRAVYIPLVNDKLAEQDKTFMVDLYDPAGETRIGPTARVTVTIRDDD